MKKLLLACILLTVMGAMNTVSAQYYRSALGIRLSSNAAVVNNSVSFKYFLKENTALEALVSFSDPVAIGLMVELHRPFSVDGLQWFYGGGGYVAFSGDNVIGAMGVIGLDYKFPTVPINLSLDWKPELSLAKDINFEPAAIGFSARFTFGK